MTMTAAASGNCRRRNREGEEKRKRERENEKRFSASGCGVKGDLVSFLGYELKRTITFCPTTSISAGNQRSRRLCLLSFFCPFSTFFFLFPQLELHRSHLGETDDFSPVETPLVRRITLDWSYSQFFVISTVSLITRCFYVVRGRGMFSSLAVQRWPCFLIQFDCHAGRTAFPGNWSTDCYEFCAKGTERAVEGRSGRTLCVCVWPPHVCVAPLFPRDGLRPGSILVLVEPTREKKKPPPSVDFGFYSADGATRWASDGPLVRLRAEQPIWTEAALAASATMLRRSCTCASFMHFSCCCWFASRHVGDRSKPQPSFPAALWQQQQQEGVLFAAAASASSSSDEWPIQ